MDLTIAVTIPGEIVAGVCIGAASGVAAWPALAAAGTVLSNLVTLGFSGQDFRTSLREGRKALPVLIIAGTVIGGGIGALTI
jgi:hypothetical protein